jgi:hypothetical protein
MSYPRPSPMQARRRQAVVKPRPHRVAQALRTAARPRIRTKVWNRLPRAHRSPASSSSWTISGRGALLRAALREAGYDAVGAPDLAEALAYPAVEPDRGPVRLIIVDQGALRAEDDTLLVPLLSRHGDAATVLLASATRGRVEGSWDRVVQRPASIGDIVDAARALLPLSTVSRPID